MAYFGFTNKLRKGDKIQIFNYGHCKRDFTFVDTTPLEEDFGFRPSTTLRDGLRAFAQWYARYYGTC